MGNPGFLPKLNSLTSGDLVDDIDLTLRLGLPCQKQHDVQENCITQDGKLDASLKIAASKDVLNATNSTNNVGVESKSPYSLSTNITNVPTHAIFGSNDVGKSGEISKACKDCGNENTPIWRKGPEGPQTLCNACGLRYSRQLRRTA